MTSNVTLSPSNATGINKTCRNEDCLTDEQLIAQVNDYIVPEPYEWIFIVIYTVVFIVGVVGNFLVCFAVFRNKSLRTVTNIFIVNLAIADFTVLIICLPLTLVTNVTETWFLGLGMCKFYLFFIPMSILVSVLTLAAISCERWLAICFPLVFKATKTVAIIAVVVIWILAIGISIPELVSATENRYFPPHLDTDLLISCHPGWDPNDQMIYQLFLIVGLYAIPLLLMALCYSHIAYVLWMSKIPGTSERSGSKKPMLNGKSTGADNQLQSRKKAAKMLIAIVIAFAICYFPVHLLNIIRYAGVLQNLGGTETIVLALISHLLPYINSALNPIIYNFMSAKFRKEFSKACFCLVPVFSRPKTTTRSNTYGMTYSQSNYSHCTVATEQTAMSSASM